MFALCPDGEVGKAADRGLYCAGSLGIAWGAGGESVGYLQTACLSPTPNPIHMDHHVIAMCHPKLSKIHLKQANKPCLLESSKHFFVTK